MMSDHFEFKITNYKEGKVEWFRNWPEAQEYLTEKVGEQKI